MLLAIDIGNTNITIGIFPILQRKSEDRTQKTASNVFSKKNNPEPITAMWRISSDPRRTADEYGTQILDFLHYSLINKEDLTAVAISSVVPPLDETIISAVKIYLNKKPVFLTHQFFLTAGLKIEVDNPNEVGVDRLVNAFAVKEIYQEGRPAIVVDFGTAVTFDCVGTKGEYLGGVILPGITAATDALARHTAKLPRVSLAKPTRLIGKNTIECIQSGMWHSYIFIIKNFISALRRELGKKTLTIATGGGMTLFSKNDLKEIDIFSPTLTLEGIKMLWEKISQGRTEKK